MRSILYLWLLIGVSLPFLGQVFYRFVVPCFRTHSVFRPARDGEWRRLDPCLYDRQVARWYRHWNEWPLITWSRRLDPATSRYVPRTPLHTAELSPVQLCCLLPLRTLSSFHIARKFALRITLRLSAPGGPGFSEEVIARYHTKLKVARF
jgi:hypothetical protein